MFFALCLRCSSFGKRSCMFNTLPPAEAAAPWQRTKPILVTTLLREYAHVFKDKKTECRIRNKEVQKQKT